MDCLEIGLLRVEDIHGELAEIAQLHIGAQADVAVGLSGLVGQACEECGFSGAARLAFHLLEMV